MNAKVLFAVAGLACFALTGLADQNRRPASVRNAGETNQAVRSSRQLTIHGRGKANDAAKGDGFYVLERGDVEEQFGGKVCKTLTAEPCSTPLAAAKVAERIFIKIYGEKVVSERPWRVAEKDGCYIVTGSMPEGGPGVIVLGGVAQLKLQKDDGRVWVFYHGK